MVTILMMAVGCNATEECTSLGFSETLQCNSCELLRAHVQDETLYEECARCCADADLSGETMTYGSGVLEVCK